MGHRLHIVMATNAFKELRMALWIFFASFLATPALLWCVLTGLLDREYVFGRDYFDIYKAMFSLDPEMVSAWLVIFTPVVLYKFALTCHDYWKHPEQLRSIFEFPRRKKH